MTTLALDFETTGDAFVVSQEGATIIVKTGVVIESDEESAVLSNFAGTTLINNGVLVADEMGADEGYGVELTQPGAHVINSASAIISGVSAGIFALGQDFTLENQGIIDSSGLDGIDAWSSFDIINNSAGGVISGHRIGIFFANGTGSTLTSAGEITSTTGYAIWSNIDTTITNTGTIIGVGGGIHSEAGAMNIWNGDGGVISSIVLDNGPFRFDVVENHGTILGQVSLGADNDTYLGVGHAVVGGTISGNNGNDVLTGGKEDDTLSGGAGSDTITGGQGDDTLFGGTSRDYFVFKGNFGNDEITDFRVSGTTHDVIRFSHALFADYAAVQAHMTQVAGDVLIELDANHSIIVDSATVAGMVAADFAFI